MKDEIENLIKEVRQAAYELHVYLGNGLLEKVYENGLRHRLERAGFRVEAQKPLTVYDDDGVVLGAYFADLVVNGILLVELKAVKSIASEHVAQLLNYLTITHQPAGLLVNFGSYKFETRIVHASSPRSPDLHVKTPPPFLFRRGERVEHGDSRPEPSPRSPDLHVKTPPPFLFRHGERVEHGDSRPAPSPRSPDLHVNNIPPVPSPAPSPCSPDLHVKKLNS